MKNTRRSFLKKVAYSAPIVVSLGMLIEPSEASARGERPPKDAKSRTSVKKPSKDLA